MGKALGMLVIVGAVLGLLIGVGRELYIGTATTGQLIGSAFLGVACGAIGAACLLLLVVPEDEAEQ